jgi:hypothetical protein
VVHECALQADLPDEAGTDHGRQHRHVR